ncbi:Deoxynucleoside kinase [Gryllus bimaculatus]|nr:Deoxynucleoside kinase [Gryllus bimaculatus]
MSIWHLFSNLLTLHSGSKNIAKDLFKMRNAMHSSGSVLGKLHGDHACRKKPFTVFVEGNIGCGKTTFLSYFNQSEAQVIAEPIELWRNVNGHNLLGTLYEDPKRWGFLFQSYVQLTMLDMHLTQTQRSLKLMERSVHSARLCFVENLHRSKIITDAEMSVLDHWYKWIKTHADVEGDLIGKFPMHVYLQTKPEVVYERMRARNRKEENCVPLSYLQQLHELHEEWLIQGSRISKPTQVIVVDANRDLDHMKGEFIRVKTLIVNELSHQVHSVSV